MIDYEKALQNTNVFSGMIYSSCRMAAWCFGVKQRNLFYTTCPDEKEFLMFFTSSGCMDYVFAPERDTTRPVFLSDSIGLIWVVDYIHYEEATTLAIVIGPVFHSASFVRGIEDSLKELNFSLRVRNSLMQKLKNVPVVSMDMIFQYAVMLHYALTEEMISIKSIQFQNPEPFVGAKSMEESDEPVRLTGKNNAERERMLEETLIQMVREGNREYLGVIEELRRFVSPDDYHAGDHLRENKDTVVIFTALCARAAVDGGLSPRLAKDLEVHYISQAEKAKTVTELMNVNARMAGDFVDRVHQCRVHPEVSKAVQECCDYIQKNLAKPLELSDIAREVGYTEYYLTKKFNKEMGIRLLDYIKESRIELSKIWLITTTKSIQDISDELYFGTRNYFSRVFREKVGMAPAAYRERAACAYAGGEGARGQKE